MESTELIDADCVDDGVTAGWRDGFESHFHALWLRDNCRCPLCGQHETGRRISKIADVSADLSVAEVTVESDALDVKWNDGHTGSFAGPWLRRFAYDDRSRKTRAGHYRLWDDAFREAPPTVDAADISDDNENFLTLLRGVQETGLCFVRDAGDVPGCIEALARRIGPIQESNFGLVQDLIFEPGGKVAQSTVALRPHTDEPYRASPPGILLFHCIQNDVTGAGASLFADGFEMAVALREEDEEAFDALCRFPQAFRRFYEDDVDLTVSFPVISVDEFGNLTGVRINDRVSAPLSIPSDQVDVYYRGKRRLAQLSEDPRFVLKKTLRPGDIAVFDNHRVLHGRTELTPTGRRWLQWVQVERGDLHSTIRIVSDRLGLDRGEQPEMRGAYG